MNDRSRPGPLQKYAWGLLAAGVVAGTSLHAAAAETPPSPLSIDLGWEAPESCPRTDDIERDVRQLLGDTPLPESVPPIAAQVSIRENSDRTLEVRVRTTSGAEAHERALHVETCAEAQKLVAFVLAFLVDPRAREARPSEARPAAQSATAPATAAPVRPEPAPPPTVTRRYGRWTTSVLAAVDVGMLPSASVGAELRAGLLFSVWSVEARAAAWLPRRAESSSVAGAGGKFTLLDAGAFGCLRLEPWEDPTIVMCAGPVLLSLWGTGYGVEAPGKDHALFAAGEAEAALLVAISSRTWLRLGLGALVPFRRPTFAIHGVGTIHRPDAAAARAALGFEVGF